MADLVAEALAAAVAEAIRNRDTARRAELAARADYDRAVVRAASAKTEWDIARDALTAAQIDLESLWADYRPAVEQPATRSQP